jgi:transcriptional repressor NrdR
VLESRSAEAGVATRRRRECAECGYRFTTYERYEQALFVRKRNGSRQPFDSAKLRGALARAAHKRPVSESEIDTLTAGIESALIEAGGEMESNAIGELCLDGLREVDHGAYLQFAGTLPSQETQMLALDSEFAGSLRAGSVRSKSNPAESTSRPRSRRE